MGRVFPATSWIILAVSCAAGADAPRFNVVELLGFEPNTFNNAQDINNVGQATGTASTPSNGNGLTFRTAPNASFKLDSDIVDPRPPVANSNRYSIGMSINSAGQIAGFGYFDSNDYIGFLIPTGGTLDIARDNIGQLAGGSTAAYAVNNLGQVTGDSGGHAFRTAPNAKINPQTDDLGTLGGATSGAYDINDSGVAVGDSMIGGSPHAFRSPPNGVNGPLIDLGTLGGAESMATAINNAGQIVGNAQNENAEYHAFKLAIGELMSSASDLGTLGGLGSAAWDINEMGWVVGSSGTVEGPRHAFLHDGSVMWDLNDLIPSDSPWVIMEASAINDSGQIIAYAQRGDVFGYLRLDPVPEPAASLLLLMMAGALGRRRVRNPAR